MNGPNISKRVTYSRQRYTGCGRLLREIFVSEARATGKKFSVAAVALLKSGEARPGGRF